MSVATIVEVMESWPLGLRLRPRGGDEDVFRDLSEDCRIVRGGMDASAAELRPGVAIRYEDSPTGIVRIEIV